MNFCSYIFLGLMFFIQASLAWAEDVPASLESIPNPGWESEQTMSDPVFARKLEEDGDLRNAILEYKRIAYSTFDDKQKEHALFKISQLYQKIGEHPSALKSLSKLGESFPQSEKLSEALYMAVISSISTGQDAAGFIHRLHKKFPNTDYFEQAELSYLWDIARSGADTFPEVGSQKGKELRLKLDAYPVKQDTMANYATLFSFIPGLGHLYLGDWRTALVAFLINGIFLFALFSALRQKHWGYATIIGFVTSILYIGTLFSAHSLTYRQALETRLDAMKTWENLIPRKPVGKVKDISSLSPLESPLWVYRNIIGTFDGERGNGAPVTSLYTAQAYQKYGIALGTLIGVDRLLRDWREISSPLATTYTDDRVRYVDPLERNTFWIELSS